MSDGFQRVLDHIRSIAGTEAEKGRLFERLMKAYFREDPLYGDRFSDVWLWSEWRQRRPEFGPDIGVDLVAEERGGGYCAIQCKCHAPGTRTTKKALDSFISASARAPFTARIVVDTGDEWGPNAIRTLNGLEPKCHVLRFGDLASRPFDWPDLVREAPEALSLRREPFRLRPHQQRAFDDVLRGLAAHDRGKLIMACGTGKTFTALRIAEGVAGESGRVLYLVPSISLFQQSMREWAEQRELPHRYIGICSDTRAGRSDEDASFLEMEIPVTTDPGTIGKALRYASSKSMTVVFCTYHSLGLVERAQDEGAPPFDLVLCDEAHRTTGVERPGDKTSPFVLVHDANRIRTRKRLYMTATPRLYTEGAKTRAASHHVEVFSMDDEATYGPEFHRLPFSRAVEQDLLSDYKVVVLALSEAHADQALQAHLASSGGTINLSDAARMIGCWQALRNPENRSPGGDGPVRPLGRAIAFTKTIASSKLLAEHWSGVVEQATALLPEAERRAAFQCETRHVDGQNHALERKSRIEWLKGSTDGACRILSNARCLSEGIDVPALDAVIFMTERRSVVDIVQAVGRAMRKAEGKTYGYIVLPVAVPAGRDPALILDSGKEFDVVWSVLRALRSHDDRLDAEINKIDLNDNPTDRIIFNRDGLDGDSLPDAPALPFPPLDLPPGAIYAKIVEKCGDRKYWESWAADVADIFSRLVTRIEGLLDHPDNVALSEWFEAFHEELRVSINDSITTQSAIDMMAQHLLTRPVFEALFEHYDFAGGNPVARALDALRRDFGEFGLENETRDLEGFYESVRLRARGLDNPEARQRVLMELYEKFFATAMKKDADRLGIVYTPVEIVDFILTSADAVLRREFGRSLGSEGVHILDPFTGTGIFLVRLLQSALIRDADLRRKYREELHANELVLLAYYIAAIHIEEAFRGRVGDDGTHEPFGGIVLTDTFNLHTERAGFPRDWLPDNSERAERQQKLPIQVIVGNPPWSVGQKSSADDNPNVDYPELEHRVAETYAARSTATNKNSLYDTYKMAIRWASDRISERGVVAFVTNGYWLYGNVDSGVRACLAEEFSTVYVLNLRGNARTFGERRRAEGGNVFGQGSRAPVAITILVRNPQPAHKGCRILYCDIGDYLSREEKLVRLRDCGSISGIDDWHAITPNRYYDWINQRDEAFARLYLLGSKTAKAGKTDETVFRLFSNGYKTGRDAYLYSFSRAACAENARKMVRDYRDVSEVREEYPVYTVDDPAKRHSSRMRRGQALRDEPDRDRRAGSPQDKVWKVQYRPFVKQHCYVDHALAQRKYQQDSIFPSPDTDNRAICVPATGSRRPFAALMVDAMPDLHLVEDACQCFPRYRFERPEDVPGAQGDLLDSTAGTVRIDNITDTALRAFRVRYEDNTITKDAIFDYVYGILHAPAYRERFANDLAKELPRVPFAPEFQAFAAAGNRLAELHLDYENGEEWPLEVVFARFGKRPSSEEGAGSTEGAWTGRHHGPRCFRPVEARTGTMNPIGPAPWVPWGSNACMLFFVPVIRDLSGDRACSITRGGRLHMHMNGERDFVGYGKHPPDPKWPNGARLALNFVVNVEEGGEPSVPDGASRSESGLTELGPQSSNVQGRDLAAESMFEYGSRVAVWRVLGLFASTGMPCTLFACAEALRRNPALCAEVRESDHDICAHGFRWEKHYELDENTERVRIRDTVASIRASVGARPLGWYCRYGPSLNTRRLIVEEGGFTYDSDSYADELPFWMDVGGRPHLVVPYSLATNDTKFVRAGIATGAQFFEFLRDSVEVLLAEGDRTPKMMSVGLHPRLVGHPGRFAGLQRFVHWLDERDGIWIAHRIDIARHWMSVHPPPGDGPTTGAERGGDA